MIRAFGAALGICELGGARHHRCALSSSNQFKTTWMDRGRAPVVGFSVGAHNADDLPVRGEVKRPWRGRCRRGERPRDAQRIAENQRRLGVDGDRLQLADSRDVEQLLSIRRPERVMGKITCFREELITRTGRRKWLYVDLRPRDSLFGRRIGDPPAVRREVRRRARHGFDVAERRCRPVGKRQHRECVTTDRSRR